MKEKLSPSEILLRYSRLPVGPTLAYGTVRDYCDSVDHFPELATRQNDLKDAQRPWAVKAILNRVKSGARLLEVGSGEPLAASLLTSLGYQVTVCDPFDGSGRGPSEYEVFKTKYPRVQFIRSLFTPDIARQFPSSFACIYSISVLEHVPPEHLGNLFEAIKIALIPGGSSIHAIDHVLEGKGSQFHEGHLIDILIKQQQLRGETAQDALVRKEFKSLCAAALSDLETFFLSAQGHNLWRGGLDYDSFPFRKCISVQSTVCQPVITNGEARQQTVGSKNANGSSLPSDSKVLTSPNSNSLSGHLDMCDPTILVGWAADKASPQTSLFVDIKVNGQLIGVAPCNNYRQDLQLAEYGDGNKGFAYKFPSTIAFQGPALVEVFFSGTDLHLPNGCQTIKPKG